MFLGSNKIALKKMAKKGGLEMVENIVDDDGPNQEKTLEDNINALMHMDSNELENMMKES